MWNKFKNIQTILFSTYSLIIIIIFTILVLWFYLWASDLLRQNATDSIENLAQSMQEKLDSEMQKMNDVSLNVMYSNLVKDHFKQYLSDTDLPPLEGKENNPYNSNSFESAKALEEILTAAIGPSRPVVQLYLYDFTSKVYGNGLDNGERTYRPEDKPWFQKLLSTDVGKYIHLPVPDDYLTKFLSSSKTQYSVSLFRLFYDNYNEAQGVIEVKQYYDRIFKGMIDYLTLNPNRERMIVYDDAGNIIFPLHAALDTYKPYIEKLGSVPATQTNFIAFTNPNTAEKELISYNRSELTGWHTAIIASEKNLLAPLFSFAKQTVIVGFIILIFAIFLSFIAAKRITLPILKIHRTIRNIQLENIGTSGSAIKELNSGLNEMDELHGSFLEMSTRLKHSMDELLLSQSQELQAKLVALQTQMNPHFLYNTLTTISVMAEENMNQEIIAMAENMSDFLRYIASDQSVVDLKTELLHTRKYLEINQIRHGHKLQHDFDIDEQILELHVPKLIVQPLVENAIKFATKKEPPWNIRVRGFVDGSQWKIEVTDDGVGFSEESIAHLQQRMQDVNQSHTIPVLKLGGMGLLNIYIRLNLTYGAKSIFQIENLPQGGAKVTIGGYIEDKGE